MKLKWDMTELFKFGNRLASTYELETSLMTVTKEIAKVLHQHILTNTPIDTGNLRKMWSAGDNLMFTVERVAGGYKVTLINTARNPSGFKYGIPVNDGHKTPNGEGWVMGKFFVEKSVLMTENSGHIERIIRKELDEWFRWCLSG